MTALLPPSFQVRSHGARAVGLIGRGGPALRRRPRSLEAGLLLRLRAGTWARTCGGGPCCLLSSLRASAPARGLRMRGNARTGRGGNRDGPSLASHCARAAERAAHADTDGHATSSSAEVPDARTAATAEARRGAITTTEAAVATRTEQRAAAKAAARRDTSGRAEPRASAAPASVRVVRKARAAAHWRTALAVQQNVGAAFAAGARGGGASASRRLTWSTRARQGSSSSGRAAREV